MEHQPVNLDQLARLYDARNAANGRMSTALRGKDPTLIRLAKDDAGRWNRAYDDARRQYKKQQKAAHRAAMRTSMIKFYLDAQEVADE